MRQLNPDSARRYDRQIALPAIDLDGQERLLNSHLVIIGCGGLGCHAAQILAAAGVGKLSLVDDDRVSESNLARQILFGPQDIGEFKVNIAKHQLQSQNPDCDIAAVSQRLELAALTSLFTNATLVLDCTDNKHSREQINAACVEAQTPLISGAAIGFDGQLFCWQPDTNAACYQCLSQLFKQPELSCSETGVLSSLVMIIAGFQANLALTLLACETPLPVNKLQLFDARNLSWQTLAINPNPECKICTTKDQAHAEF